MLQIGLFFSPVEDTTMGLWLAAINVTWIDWSDRLDVEHEDFTPWRPGHSPCRTDPPYIAAHKIQVRTAQPPLVAPRTPSQQSSRDILNSRTAHHLAARRTDPPFSTAHKVQVLAAARPPPLSPSGPHPSLHRFTKSFS